MTYKML